MLFGERLEAYAERHRRIAPNQVIHLDKPEDWTLEQWDEYDYGWLTPAERRRLDKYPRPAHTHEDLLIVVGEDGKAHRERCQRCSPVSRKLKLGGDK